MNKNIKFLFIGVMILLLVCMGSAAAVDDSGNTTVHATDSIKTTHNVDDTTLDDDIKSTPKNINKQTKKAVETTQTATDYESLKNAQNNIQADGDNTTQYTINLKNGKYDFTQELTSTTTTNSKYITINGEDTDNTIFDAANKTRFFTFNATNQVIKLNNITFTNGFNVKRGGAIYNQADLSIENCKFTNNSIYATGTSAQGGVIYTIGNLSVNNSSFTGNLISNTTKYPSAQGGCIYKLTNDNTINIKFSTFKNNMISTSITRSIDGVAIYARSYTLGNNSISNCYFKNNTATKSTSTVFTNITNLNPVEDSEMVTKYCVFENNIGNLGGCRGLDYNYYADRKSTRLNSSHTS